MVQGYKPIRELPDFPEVVYIVGSGPNGVEHYKDIPPDAFVIAVNRAASIPFVIPDIKWKVSLWVVGDSAAIGKHYFQDILNRYDGPVLFSYVVMLKVKLKEFVNGNSAYYFQFGNPQNKNSKIYTPSSTLKIQHGSSVSGHALEVCYFKSVAKRGKTRIVRFVGVDMSLDKDFIGDTSVDSRHGEVWRNRDALDRIVEYAQRQGITVETLSKTKLLNPTALGQAPNVKFKTVREPHVTLPAVGLLTMAYLEPYTLDAITEAYRQIYPDDFKTQYLMYQEPYPVHGRFEKGRINVLEYDVSGVWSKLWFDKMQCYLDETICPVTAIFDEGKRYAFDYLTVAINTLIKSKKKICWNPEQVIVSKKGIYKVKYSVPYGTMVIYTDVLREAVALLKKQYPEGFFINKRGAEVPLDGPLCKILESRFKAQLVLGKQERYYIFHSQSNTFMVGTRKDPTENVDYADN